MRLIGMLDSPYVRRVAISAQIMGLAVQHESISLFSQQDAFTAINPVLKAPTLVTGSGVILMDSSLILEYFERLVSPERGLIPQADKPYLRAQRLIGLALVACEKTVQLVYEFRLRPAEKQHQPWIDRLSGQLLAAYRLLDEEVGAGDAWLIAERPLQADITVAVAWRFTQLVLAEQVSAREYPALAALSARAELLSAFQGLSPDWVPPV